MVVPDEQPYCLLVVVIPPIVIAAEPECWFYRCEADALAAGIRRNAKVFDGTGQRLQWADNKFTVLASDRDGSDELRAIVSDWLCHMDAIRWSIADWDLSMMLRCAIEHQGFS
jgi:hypothetical protein